MKTKMLKNKNKIESTKAVNLETKHSRIKQTDFPRLSLREAVLVAEGLRDNFAAKSAAPHQLAMALNISPASSNWRYLSGASIAYGLTAGGYNAQAISLSELGKRVVAPTDEGDDVKAMLEAAIKPQIAHLFFEKYNRSKFPQDKIAKNVLLEFGVPAERIDDTLKILIENGIQVGIIKDTKTGLYVAIDDPVTPVQQEIESRKVAAAESSTVDVSGRIQGNGKHTETSTPISNQRVYISHGKNKEIVQQLKDLLSFGKYVPVVSEEHETPSKPVPKKVIDEMKSCSSGVIHIASEEELLDKQGNVLHRINENVLIEIGAALASYGENLVLLVQKGIHLPSNLQGLYNCYYDGEKLDYEATMKLLKAFSQFN